MIQNTTVHRFDYIQILNSRTLKNSKKNQKMVNQLEKIFIANLSDSLHLRHLL